MIRTFTKGPGIDFNLEAESEAHLAVVNVVLQHTTGYELRKIQPRGEDGRFAPRKNKVEGGECRG